MTPSQRTSGQHADVPILVARGIGKSYESTKVLSGVHFEIPDNSVISFVGENGAGKSTLLNIISGIVEPDEGSMVLNGEPYCPAGYSDAMRSGVTRVFQEQALIHNAPVYENLLISEIENFCRAGVVLRSKMVALAQKAVDEAGIDVDVTRRTGDYDFSTRQSIEIVRECMMPLLLGKAPRPLVLLDEPTSALDRRDEDAFFRLVKKVKQYGSLLFVSHRLTEVLAISDQICVLKDGELVAVVEPETTDEKMLHGLMVGREMAADYYYQRRQRAVDDQETVLRIVGLSRSGEYEPVDLDVRAGEVVGIGGLLDSGKTAFGKGVAGVDLPDSGTVAVGRRQAARPDISKLVRQGLGYVPAERLVDGLIASFSVAWNLSLASGGDIFSTPWGGWRGGRERDAADRFISSLAIRSAKPAKVCARLSGGNQQKVVLARWLCRNPSVLVLDNPTRGVDAGAKEEIYRLIRELTEAGVAILLITDELLELIGLSNRILIMQRGRIVANVDAPPDAKPSERELVALMLPQGSSAAEVVQLRNRNVATDQDVANRAAVQ